MISRYLRKVAVPVACLLLGGITGFMIRGTQLDTDIAGQTPAEQREGSYTFINPLLECDIAKTAMRNTELSPFKHDAEEFIKNRLEKKWAKNVSVYFRELNDGLWFSIGDMDRFTIASLRKVPMMIAFLKKAESDRNILSRMVRYSLKRDYNASQAIKPSQVMTSGKSYTVEELLYRMIVYSDNNAFTLLASIVDPDELERVYRVFSLKPPGTDLQPDYQSVVVYASFFRILYNASYLNREMSEKALELLSKSEFRAGIVSGVPPEIPVAHKFGENWNPDNGLKELHDCGIVYYPMHPYLLCIMSRGENLEYLDDAVASISRGIFMHVDEQHSKHKSRVNP